MGDFSSDTLRDSIESGWAPANTRIPKTTSAGIEQIVHFLAHPQKGGAHEWPLAITVESILDPQVPDNENQVVHPRFTENIHRFTISCEYRLRNIDETLWDQAEQDVEDMCIEVIRILKTVYNPQAGTGAFFTARYNWRNEDDFATSKEKPIIRRVLDFTLTEIQSDSTEVFRGYGGVLVFDLSASSNMDNAPAGDYTYTEAYDVTADEGVETISIMTRNSSSLTGKPAKFRGIFSGTLTASMYAKKSDLNGASADKLDNIYKAQANGEHIEAILLDSVDNTEGTPATLTNSTPILVTRIRRQRRDEDLVRYILTGDIREPTTASVA